MATVPDIPVVQVSVREGDALPDVAASFVSTWAPVEVPRGRRPTPIVLAVLGVLAGIGAMVLGGAAVFWAGTGGGGSSAAPAPAAGTMPRVEQRVLSLLAKPSTERIVFRGSAGRLVLAVGSGGRAAILSRGLERAPTGKAYHAWVIPSGVVGEGSAPKRAARIVGTERAVFLSVPVGPGASVVVSAVRPGVGRTPWSQVIASRR